VKGDDLQQDVEFERYRESLEFQIKQVDQIQKALGVFAFGFLGTIHTTRHECSPHATHTARQRNRHRLLLIEVVMVVGLLGMAQSTLELGESLETFYGDGNGREVAAKFLLTQLKFKISAQDLGVRFL
jgi:hypothetical protein